MLATLMHPQYKAQLVLGSARYYSWLDPGWWCSLTTRLMPLDEQLPEHS